MKEQDFNKILEGIYFLPSNWIEECFESKKWIIPHFQGRYDGYCQQEGLVGAFFRTWISFDAENRTLFYNYFNKLTNK